MKRQEEYNSLVFKRHKIWLKAQLLNPAGSNELWGMKDRLARLAVDIQGKHAKREQ